MRCGSTGRSDSAWSEDPEPTDTCIKPTDGVVCGQTAVIVFKSQNHYDQVVRRFPACTEHRDAMRQTAEVMVRLQ